MFPWILLYPFILAASLAWPAVQSLNALHTKNANEMKVWLWYWTGFAVCHLLFSIPGFESIVSLPFTIIGTILFDVYYEVQLGVIVWLVNPKVRGLDQVIAQVETQGQPLIDLGLQKLNQVQDLLAAKINEKTAAKE